MKRFDVPYRQFIVERLRSRFYEREQLKDVTFAVEKMLKLPPVEAERQARAGAARRAKLNRLVKDERPGRALRSLRRMTPARELGQVVRELEKYADTSYLLALPLTVSSVLLLARLAEDESRQFCLVGTPLTCRYLKPLLDEQAGGRVKLLSSSEMLAHNSRRLEAGSHAPVTYVTFPDHQMTAGATMWRINFLGEEYQFTTLEPLLFFRGVAPLFTLEASADNSAGRLSLVAYPGASKPDAVSEADVRAVLTWLAGHLESVFREMPVDVLSWMHAVTRSARIKSQITVMKLKLVEGYVRAWHTSGTAMNTETYAWSMAELRKLQETVNAFDRSAHAAT
ncbi:MAG TPA: hypothetical protein VGV59_06035 [Pyrinomonadaceae bacterium]|nr:hypothetical protein [Pyrinomonadaceae bacterium]